MIDAVVVGSGPNGLSAAITLARAGLSVRVLEANEFPGGGMRSAALTLPGFIHDPCSAVFPLGIASPFFRSLPRDGLGTEWLHGPSPLVHVFEDGHAFALSPSLNETAARLGDCGRAYHKLLRSTVENWEPLLADLLGPPLRIPHHPLQTARFGLRALRSARSAVRALSGDAAGLWAGVAAHSAVPLSTPMSAAPTLLLLAAAHREGWPVARGGTGSLCAALANSLGSLGGELEMGHPIRSFGDIPPARVVLFDTSPAQLLAIAGERIHGLYRRQLSRYRPGASLFKLDYALDGPVPWTDPACLLSPTVHIGGSYRKIAASELDVARGRAPRKPFIIAAQPSLFDASRAPAGCHTLWAYCHVPAGCGIDMTEPMEDAIERVAPGFQRRILMRAARGPAELERENRNFPDGAFANGAMQGLQLLFRPAIRLDPYSTPLDGVFLCSGATPPGPGVHGMCGYWAARSALRSLGIESPQLSGSEGDRSR